MAEANPTDVLAAGFYNRFFHRSETVAMLNFVTTKEKADSEHNCFPVRVSLVFPFRQLNYST